MIYLRRLIWSILLVACLQQPAQAFIRFGGVSGGVLTTIPLADQYLALNPRVGAVIDGYFNLNALPDLSLYAELGYQGFGVSSISGAVNHNGFLLAGAHVQPKSSFYVKPFIGLGVGASVHSLSVPNSNQLNAGISALFQVRPGFSVQTIPAVWIDVAVPIGIQYGPYAFFTLSGSISVRWNP